jgi:signal transduction histidine kinase
VNCLNELPGDRSLWVNGDRLRLVQALRNLMLNAIQAMSRSGGELRITATTDDAKNIISLCIIDNGPGFTEAALAHAQNLFFSEREGGMGVGLSVVSEVIAAHGGTLQLANHQPHGASVTISLPRPHEHPVSPN